jgi:uncharacterized protein (DUF2147 family)
VACDLEITTRLLTRLYLAQLILRRPFMLNAKTLLLALVAAVAPLGAHAQMTPVGAWKTVDDRTQAVRSLVRITQVGGALVGRIERRFDSNASPQDVCKTCTDDRRNAPIDGLEIIRGVNAAHDGDFRWDGGKVLDPESGKVYRLRLTPLDGGKKLEVRGYIGPFFRSQVWVRAE